MKLKMYVFLTLTFLFQPSLFSQLADNHVRNFYVELKSDGETIEFGEYLQKRFDRKIFFKLNPDTLNEKNLSDFFSKSFLSSDISREALIYFHCMWGNEKHFNSRALKGLNKTYSLNKNCKVNTTISFLWHAGGLNYNGNWDRASVKGKKISNVFRLLVNSWSGRSNILCHSMGNRVFEGIVANLDTLPIVKTRELILAAADLDPEIFKNEFKNLDRIAQRICVYQNKKDRLLMVSSILHGKDRLGSGSSILLDSLLLKDNYRIVDVTNTKSVRFIDLSNHVYFHFNPVVKKDIATLLSHSLFEPKERHKLVVLRK